MLLLEEVCGSQYAIVMLDLSNCHTKTITELRCSRTFLLRDNPFRRSVQKRQTALSGVKHIVGHRLHTLKNKNKRRKKSRRRKMRRRKKRKRRKMRRRKRWKKMRRRKRGRR
jgi:hypothetical protein